MRRDTETRRLAADPALQRLWAAARARLEATGGRVEGVSLSIRAPTPEERRAVELLLGVTKSGKSLRVPLDGLDRALWTSPVGVGLAAFLEEVGGPLADRPGERMDAARAEERLWGDALGHDVLCKHPGLSGWIEALRQSGALKRAAGDDPGGALQAVLGLLSDLPADGVARAVLAAQHFGDAHALDDSRALSRLTLGALSHLDGEPAPKRAADRRTTWEQFGVHTDEVSSTVLALGLRPALRGGITRAAGSLADAGVAFPVTLEMLVREVWEFPEVPDVRVCENPTILAVAARTLGRAAPPMVCPCGMPSVAGRKLLRALGDAGCVLHYHGDFGPGGIRIGNVIIGELGARPWRFCAPDYQEALSRVAETTPFTATVPDAVWDPALAGVVNDVGREVHEEQLLDLLLGDLRDCEFG